MTASLVDDGLVSGCLVDISAGTYDVTVIVSDGSASNTLEISSDPSKLIESLKTKANIPQGFKFFYLTIIGVTGTVFCLIVLMLTGALF